MYTQHTILCINLLSIIQNSLKYPRLDRTLQLLTKSCVSLKKIWKNTREFSFQFYSQSLSLNITPFCLLEQEWD